jgi:hypothetical protein
LFSLILPVSPYNFENDKLNLDPLWTPLPELAIPENSTLTLIFVSSLRILYKTPSGDPIFPADQQVDFSGDKRWYRNSDPRARPLACVNSIEACLADEKTCFPMTAPPPTPDVTSTNSAFWLMYSALDKTDIIDSIWKRLGRGLLAQNLVSQYFSEGLSDRHWVEEVKRLVATTHAMTQINAWSVSRGEDSDLEEEGYVLESPPDIVGDLCGHLKFNPQGYVSIHFIPFLLICFVPIALWALSYFKWPFLWPAEISARQNRAGLNTSTSTDQLLPPQQPEISPQPTTEPAPLLAPIQDPTGNLSSSGNATDEVGPAQDRTERFQGSQNGHEQQHDVVPVATTESSSVQVETSANEPQQPRIGALQNEPEQDQDADAESAHRDTADGVPWKPLFITGLMYVVFALPIRRMNQL